MTEWEPATDAELAMRDALRTDDQESYFRILSNAELLLPVSAEALAGHAPLGWGTWSSGGRTHVLAFTSPSALQACLADYAGSARRVPYAELADTWPNLEWWLAVNPGLPIEGYLPAWFVAQLARGDLRLPVRSPHRDTGVPRDTPAATPAAEVPAPPVEPAADPAATPVPVGAGAGHVDTDGEFGRATAAGSPGRSAGALLGGVLPTRVPSASTVTAPAPVPAASDADASTGGPPAEDRSATGGSPVDEMAADDDSAYSGSSTNGSAADGSAGSRPGDGAPATHDDPAMQPGQHDPAPGGPLPRRPLTPASERPASMAAAAQAIAEARTTPPAPQPATPPTAAAPTTGPAAPETPDTPPPSRSADDDGDGDSGGDPASGPASDPDDDFVPANEVEQDLLSAADGGNTDIFLSTLLLATVLVPVASDSESGSVPGEPGFGFRTEDNGGETFLVVFTSQDRLVEHYLEPVRTHGVRFFELISNWPDSSWSFAVNPGSPVGAKLPGSQVVALASWAAEAGLGTDEAVADTYERVAEPVPVPHSPPGGEPPQQPTVMQKTVPPEQVDYFLERGYDRVSGFVHRANEVEHLRTPGELHAALGLGYEGSPHSADAVETYVLRWPAYRPSLYRIPYGGQGEQALRAMDGWVIERPPFRGNGFAPGEGRDVIAEFKVDSARLPHGSELWRMDADGGQELVAVFDCDQPAWRRLGGR